MVLGAAVMVAGASSLMFERLVAEDLTKLVDWYLAFTADAGGQQGVTAEAQGLARQVIMGLFAMGQAYAMISFLVLARWWQSQLYNPGGLRAEFHQLRLPPTFSRRDCPVAGGVCLCGYASSAALGTIVDGTFGGGSDWFGALVRGFEGFVRALARRFLCTVDSDVSACLAVVGIAGTDG